MSFSRIALITGGSKRVGASLCVHLAQQGYDVIVHYHRSFEEAAQTVKQCEAFGVRAVALQADLSQAGACASLIEQSASALGVPSLLVHNASLFARDRIEDFTAEQLQQHMAIHCYAPLHLLQAWAPHVEASDMDDGCCVLLGDGLKDWSISPSFFTYALSKQALPGMAALLAQSLAPHIRVNVIACGATLPGDIDDDAAFQKLRALSPLQRLSNPEEIARTVDFLVATPTITGQCIALNAGMHLFHKKA